MPRASFNNRRPAIGNAVKCAEAGALIAFLLELFQGISWKLEAPPKIPSLGDIRFEVIHPHALALRRNARTGAVVHLLLQCPRRPGIPPARPRRARRRGRPPPAVGPRLARPPAA